MIDRITLTFNIVFCILQNKPYGGTESITGAARLSQVRWRNTIVFEPAGLLVYTDGKYNSRDVIA